MSIDKAEFGKTQEGKQIFAYTLTNANSLKAEIITYGGIITRLFVPDKNGKLADIVLGYDNIKDYEKDSVYLGAIIGRYGNRIANAKFTLDGKEYKLAANNGAHNLHGGPKGFHKVVWDAQTSEQNGEPSIKLSYTAADGEEGFPGKLDCTVTYTLTKKNDLKIDYEAKTDKATVINMTQHSYFNLGGFNSGDILGNELTINADNYTVPDDTSIPTGEIATVLGTGLDFTKPHTVGERIAKVKGGYDHNYVLNKSDKKPAFAGRVREPKSGRIMEVYTTEPGMQFYSGNFLTSAVKGKGAVYNKNHALCLETQHYPDSPNKPQFPSTVLKAGAKYTTQTIYKFDAK